VQSAALSLQKLRHGRSGGPTRRRRCQRRSLQAHRHRRRLLDGRLHRAAEGRSAISRTNTTRWSMVDDSHAVGFMGAPVAAPMSTAMSWAASTSDRHARQSPRRRQWRLHERQEGDHRAAPPALAAVFVLEHLCPSIAGASLTALNLLKQSTELARHAGGEHTLLPRRNDRRRLQHRAWRASHRFPSCSAMPRSPRSSPMLLERGVYVIGFSYPVVPQGKARIRTQISAAHTREDLEH
jgi:glycine C-acetyltransferase